MAYCVPPSHNSIQSSPSLHGHQRPFPPLDPNPNPNPTQSTLPIHPGLVHVDRSPVSPPGGVNQPSSIGSCAATQNIPSIPFGSVAPTIPHDLLPGENQSQNTACRPITESESLSPHERDCSRLNGRSDHRSKRRNKDVNEDENDQEESHESSRPRKNRKVQRSWRNDQNMDGKCSLDYVVDWLTTDDHYDLWREGKRSKRDLAECVVKFLEENHIQGRDWRGVEQQITNLERKYRKVLDWKNQTGQRIQDEAESDRARLSDDSTSSNIVEIRREALNKISMELKRRCFYFFQLDPVLSRWASAIPSTYVKDSIQAESWVELDAVPGRKKPAFQHSVDDDASLRIHQSPSEGMQVPNGVTHSKQASLGTTRQNRIPLQPSQPSSSYHRNAFEGESRPKTNLKKKLNLKDILDSHRQQIEQQIHHDAEVSEKFLSTFQAITKSNHPTLAPTNDPSNSEEEKRRAALEIEKLELEVKEKRLEIESHTVLLKARMIQDFLKAGLSKQDAIEMTNDLFLSDPSA